MRFANPEVFLLAPLVPFLLWWTLRPRHHAAATFSQVRLAAKLPAQAAVWGPTLLVFVRGMALLLLLTALARPQTVDANEKTHSDGIAIELVIDNSYSMRTKDYDSGPRSISRLDAVKHAVSLFVKGGEHGLEGRPNDRIGVITFARDPDVICPLTLDHKAVLEAVDHIQLAPPVGTNIGDSLAWGLDRLRHEQTQEKVLILLSDGSQNVKEGLPPLDAAQLAADLHVKVYTIGAVGNRFQKTRGPSHTSGSLSFGYQQESSEDSVDEPLMQKIAERTHGQYFRATDTDGLLRIYQEIDRLETSKIETTVRVAHKEWWFFVLLPSIGLLALEQLLAATRLLRIP
jgi:Ca-activated chloride channel family protein